MLQDHLGDLPWVPVQYDFYIPSSSCRIPAIAAAYSLNVTAVPQGPLAWLTMWPTGQIRPLVSTLNSPNGQTIANAAIVPAGTSGGISVYVTDNTDVIVDVNGYFAYPPAQSSSAGTTMYGSSALWQNTTGIENTAFGSSALYANTVGNGNTAIGTIALYGNTSGSNNTAFGEGALSGTKTGNFNTALGSAAAVLNTSGEGNTALGGQALYLNTTGNANTGVGEGVLYYSLASFQVAVGYEALFHSTADSNVAFGYHAGYNVTTGTQNIEIGNQGTSSDSNVIRIGDPADQRSAFIAGISGVNVGSGSTVLINANGNLAQFNPRLGTSKTFTRWRKAAMA